MDQARYARLNELFIDALRMPPHQRDAWLENACDDPDLRQDVRRLLDAEADADNDIASETRIRDRRKKLDQIYEESLTQQNEAATDADVPQRIGHYRVIRRIAVGGMGAVYEAEQSSPARRVAVKVIHSARLSPGLLARFKREAEILGRLQHPAIAQIYEADVIEADHARRPFYAMEFIDGQNLTTWSETHDLDLRGRLELLARICDGADYAHRKGVVHRDLKPDNILVNEHGQPRILDFGVARVGGDASIAATTVTNHGQILGTLAYMAPEQLARDADDVDGRADVYALGAVAYELLAGRTPHDLADRTVGGAIRILENEDPAPLRIVADDVPCDVRTIIGKALERDRERRYASAAALAADIRRFLNNQPIEARPPTRAYRARKFIDRNRALFTGTAAAFIALIIGLAASIHFGLEADRQRIRAVQREQEAARNATEAHRGLLLAAHRFFETDDPWNAVEQLALIPPERRGWEWRFIARQLPFIIYDTGAGGAWIDEHRRVSIPKLGETGLDLIDIRDPERITRIFPDLPIRAIAYGNRGPVLTTHDADSVMRVVDINAESVLDEWPVQHHGALWPGRNPREFILRQNASDLFYYRDGEFQYQLDFAAKWPVVLVHPEEPLAVISAANGLIRLVNLDAGDVIRTTTIWRNPGIDMHPSGDFFVGLGRDGMMARFDFQTLEPIGAFGPHPGPVTPIISGDGRFLRTECHTDRMLRIFNLETGELLHTRDHGKADSGHRGSVSPNGQWLDGRTPNAARAHVVGTDPRTWNPEPFTELSGHTSWIYPVALSHDGAILVTGAPEDPDVRVWDVRAARQIATIPWKKSYPLGMGACMAFTTDDETFLMAAGDPETGERALLTLNLNTGEQIWTPIEDDYFTAVDHMVEALGSDFHGPLNEYTWVRQNGDVIEACPHDGAQDAYVQKASGERIKTADVKWDRGAVAVDPHDHMMAFHTVRRLAIRDGYERADEIIVPEGVFEGVRGLAFSPDGSRLAVGVHDGRILILDTRFFIKVAEWQAHPDGRARYNYVWALRWTPDGKQLISAAGDGTIRIWQSEREFEIIEKRDAWNALLQQTRAALDNGSLDESALTPDERAALRIVRIERWPRD